jgi:hypothetical protein
MGETYQLIGAVRGEPLAAGRVGARLRVPLTGTPGPHWSRAFSSYLAQDLTGHCAVGHLHLNDVVQGSELVLEGVEPGEAPALGECLERAVDAANRACANDGSAERLNMSPGEAEAIAHRVEFEASPLGR